MALFSPKIECESKDEQGQWQKIIEEARTLDSADVHELLSNLTAQGGPNDVVMLRAVLNMVVTHEGDNKTTQTEKQGARRFLLHLAKLTDEEIIAAIEIMNELRAVLSRRLNDNSTPELQKARVAKHKLERTIEFKNPVTIHIYRVDGEGESLVHIPALVPGYTGNKPVIPPISELMTKDIKAIVNQKLVKGEDVTHEDASLGQHFTTKQCILVPIEGEFTAIVFDDERPSTEITEVLNIKPPEVMTSATAQPHQAFGKTTIDMCSEDKLIKLGIQSPEYEKVYEQED